MPNQQQSKEPNGNEDTQAHERHGLRVNDDDHTHVDLTEDGAIQETEGQNMWG
ncbi:hypothetical protein ACFQI7_03570 [Paenibacillus allorhizosphaerae]|uniref:DUF4025 domain-containing protein n=1 Tax=Paenibacillus allorhizosphaerae TaxID=2849866 RepID=A0ABM8VCT4_9BACL|nr:hypothetical protein [Paenibacillus allorhizosphaerae]CAG7624916.1 hypothetical protein PAECIP111802_01113 [Paenibacillus allorhizosphaerae]